MADGDRAKTGPATCRWVCQACGSTALDDQPLPFRCANIRPADDADHLMVAAWNRPFDVRQATADKNPFIAFRAGLYSHALAIRRGMIDAEYVALVRELDHAVREVDGRGFQITPWRRSDDLGVWFKDETHNVAGSHKARHLFGVQLSIEVAERTGRTASSAPGSAEQPLAIASCGNAALAAAVLARAWRRALRVFIPTWADAGVVSNLRELGAEIVTCARTGSTPPGDPCFHSFRHAVRRGAVPFTCQGPENGLVIDGGRTLGFEIATALSNGHGRLDHLYLQIGGGALASATIQALRGTADRGHPLPSIHAVQTVGCAPVDEAWRRMSGAFADVLVERGEERPEDTVAGDGRGHIPRLAAWLQRFASTELATTFFQRATGQRSRYMRPIESPASSVASGILDDETYDWFVIVREMIRSGGWPVIVTESELLLARDGAQAQAGVPVDATGSAGLAGFRVARRDHPAAAAGSAGVLFTGVQR